MSAIRHYLLDNQGWGFIDTAMARVRDTEHPGIQLMTFDDDNGGHYAYAVGKRERPKPQPGLWPAKPTELIYCNPSLEERNWHQLARLIELPYTIGWDLSPCDKGLFEKTIGQYRPLDVRFYSCLPLRQRPLKIISTEPDAQMLNLYRMTMGREWVKRPFVDMEFVLTTP